MSENEKIKSTLDNMMSSGEMDRLLKYKGYSREQKKHIQHDFEHINDMRSGFGGELKDAPIIPLILGLESVEVYQTLLLSLLDK